MATKDLTVAEKLKDLYDLQLIDTNIDQIAILKGELPIEVSDLEDEIVGLETRYSKLNVNIQELESEISKHQNNIKESETLIAKYEKQMDDVKNNREYDALTKELELQKLEIQLSEKKMKEFKHTLENKKETLAATKERVDSKKSDLETKKVELEKIILKTEKEEEKLIKKSEKKKKIVEARLLKSYTKIRSSYRNGLAVVSVERNSCGGCFNKIPPQLQLEISIMKKIIACEHCGRILIDTAFAAEPEPEAAPAAEAK